jgi:Tfp pilus assembly protein PilX
MMTTPIVHARSERGIALVVVLLLMAVLSGLATGFAMNGQVESSMAHNEVYYAGARAAAEAGMNRAIEAIRYNTDADLLSGQDGLTDSAVAVGTGVNTDNGDVGFLFTDAPAASPYALDANSQYTYTVQVFDDDDPRLYTTALTQAQLDAMAGALGTPEDGFGQTDTNNQLILRATGFGPSNTVVTLSRILLSTAEVAVPPPSLNPAILVNGDLNIGGNITVAGLAGSVHANGDLAVDGASASISKNATASGDYSAKSKNFNAGGAEGGGYASITVPDIHASNYQHLAEFILKADGTMRKVSDNSLCVLQCAGWTRVGTTWTIGSNAAPTGTFFVEGSVKISGSPGSNNNPIAMSVIATGSIDITGSPKFQPALSAAGVDHKYQFVTDGDLKIGGAAGLVDPETEGQILVREQIHIAGNPKFRGRIMVGDADDNFSDITANAIPGNPTFTYDGTLDALPSDAGAPVYTNNFSGWIEQ